ncbi:MAG: dethiobiotin synthase [Rikenellaceae bacterium]|nr:dethiobiotin synthase [Rikenellaceae bacterium]
MGKAFFVSGIDTDAGKSYATGVLAARLLAQGERVITQKFVQTGCGLDTDAVSEDIALHRIIMGTGLLPEDRDGTTCPQKFAYPASADLAARLEGRRVDIDVISDSTDKLLASYDTVLVEGAGGLMVPIDEHYTVIDYIADRGLPLILVTNPKLGSVNHTLLSLDACRARGITVDRLVYNHYPVTSDTITDDTRRYLKNYIAVNLPGCRFTEVPCIADPGSYDPARDPFSDGLQPA